MNKTITLLFLTVLLACSESKETRMQRFLAQGNDMVKKQNYEEAVVFYNGALKLDTCFADALNNLGSLYHLQKNYTSAVEYYTRTIQCDPTFISAYLNRSNSYYELNQLQQALNDLNEVEKKKPDTLVVHFSRGLVFTKLKQYEQAKQAFKNALAISPGNHELAVNMGTLYYYQRQFDSARLYLMPVVSNEPNADAYNTLAMIEIETGDYNRAITFTNQALETRPNDAYILNNRGYAYLLNGQVEEGLEDINQSITIDPYNGWAYRNKGIFYLRQNRPADAIRVLEQARDIDPSIEKLQVYLGDAYAMNRELDRACEAYKSAVTLNQINESEYRKKCPAGRI